MGAWHILNDIRSDQLLQQYQLDNSHVTFHENTYLRRYMYNRRFIHEINQILLQHTNQIQKYCCSKENTSC